MKILVTGANGFMGIAIVEALLRLGHEVVACCRSNRNLPSTPALRYWSIDLCTATHASDWTALLDGVSAVVNCAGILRESRPGDFERVHVDAPAALVAACLQSGEIKFIQISALGTSADGAFITSKHRFDEHLLESGLPSTVIRPSVVISTRGSHGGTSMLRALAALPGVAFLPGDGKQRLQPVLMEDFTELVVRCLPRSAAQRQMLHAVGPEILSIHEFLGLTRAWLKLPSPYWISTPLPMVRTLAWIGEKLNAGPLGNTIAGMLEHGNIAPRNAHAQTREATGLVMRSVREELQTAASFVQDRWHARLYLLRPVIWLLLATIWIISGLAGLLAVPIEYAPVLDGMHVPQTLQRSLMLGLSAIDITLGIALLVRWRPRLVGALMLASVLAYTLVLSTQAPALWLEPMGGLLKNLAVIGLLAVSAAIEDARR